MKCHPLPRRLGALAWLSVLAASFTWADPAGTAPLPHPPHHGPQQPPGAIALRPRCDVQLEVRTARGANGRTKITASAVNRTAAPIALTVPGRCPQGPVQFQGLPAGYDYYGTCNEGACVANPALTFTLPAHGEVPLTSVELSPKASTCTKALGSGTYALTAHVTAPGVAVCDGTVPWTIPAAPPPPPQRPAPPKVVQPPAPPCPPMPACGLACPGAFAHDANGCTQCACERGPHAIAPAH